MTYGISIEAWEKYQRDHIDRVEHTDEDEDSKTYVSASGDSWYDTQYELFTEEEQLKLLSMEND